MSRRSGIVYAAIAVGLGGLVGAYVYVTRHHAGPAGVEGPRVIVPDDALSPAGPPDDAAPEVRASAPGGAAAADRPSESVAAAAAPAAATAHAPAAIDGTSAGPAAASATSATPATPAQPPTVVYFRSTAQDASYGKLAHVAIAPDAVPDTVAGLDCEVVHVSSGTGVCLAADRGVVTTYAARIFDARTFDTRMTLPLAGLPSRTRVSRDGRFAATTVFVTGHGYDSVDFSTETLLIDLRDRKVLGNVQDFAVTRDGRPFAAQDFNFWGVTFVGDGRHFYATLSTAGEHYLVRGDVATRTATVLRPGVECPSLSPDGARIAFKRRRTAGAAVEWQIMVLDLASGSERRLAEQRTVDDQLEWLDARTVLYALPSSERHGAAVTDVWSVRIDGTQPPRRLLTNAYSPAIDR